LPAALSTVPDDVSPATPTDRQSEAPTDSIPEAPGPSAGSDNGMDDYRRLQRRLLVATALATALAVPLTALVFDIATAASLLVGSLAGLLYLRLLARSVSRLGVDRKSVGKVQLLVPIVLVLAAARIPQLQMLPALVGFLLYKPALIVQAVLDG
jgi:ATP synthase protein I